MIEKQVEKGKGDSERGHGFNMRGGQSLNIRVGVVQLFPASIKGVSSVITRADTPITCSILTPFPQESTVESPVTLFRFFVGENIIFWLGYYYSFE